MDAPIESPHCSAGPGLQVTGQGQSASTQSTAPSKSLSTPSEQSSTRSVGQNSDRLKSPTAPKRPSTTNWMESPIWASKNTAWSPASKQLLLSQPLMDASMT